MSLLLSSVIYFSSISPDLDKIENHYISAEVPAQARSKAQRKCPEYNKLKNSLVEYELSIVGITNYLLCFVYNENIVVERRVVTATPFIYPGDSKSKKNIGIPMEGAFLSRAYNSGDLLTEIPNPFVIFSLLKLFDDPERAWAAHVLLSKMTGKYGVVFPYASTPEEWWVKEGKTGKAKKAWVENFFSKSRYDVYKKFDGYLFSCPTRKCDPPGRF